MQLASTTQRAPIAGENPELIDGASLSGHERNHLFLNQGDGRMRDVSGLSGLDAPADGRAVGWLDFDHDGWLDFAVVNANAPTLQLFRNDIGDLPSAANRGAIGFRLVGGNRSAAADSAWSNRDGVGARLEIEVGDRTLVRELRAGEGFASQNSATLYAGLGDATAADRVTVRWPSGRTQSADRIGAGSLVTFYENPDHAPNDSGTVTQTLSPTPSVNMPPHRPARESLVFSEIVGASTAPLRVLTTTATWCESCRSELPDVARLRDQFSPTELDLVALPVDDTDTPEMLLAYTRQYEPRYRMLYDRSEADVKAVQELIEKRLRTDVLPASIVMNANNQVLDVFWGLPTVSDLRALQENRYR